MPEEHPWEIDLFRPDDAQGVVGLYRAIYKECFPLQEVYNADWHIEQAEKGDSYRVVARLPDGSLAGTGALFRSVATNPELYEGGGLIVLEEFRTQNLAIPIMQFMNISLPRIYNLEQIWGEAVCNHLVSQQLTIKSGYTACALEVDMMPEEAYKSLSERGMNTGSRVSALVVFQALCPKPQNLYLPLAYQDVIKKIYAPFNFEHSFLEQETRLKGELDTFAYFTTMPGAGMSRITVAQIGTDFAAWLKTVEDELLSQVITVVQVILPLDTLLVDHATEELRKQGYWLGGLMPGWFGHDGFLMQKTIHEPDFSKIKVYSKPGKEILQMVKEDYEKRGER